MASLEFVIIIKSGLSISPQLFNVTFVAIQVALQKLDLVPQLQFLIIIPIDLDLKRSNLRLL